MADDDAPRASESELKQFESLVPLLEREGPFAPREFIPGAAENIADLASVRHVYRTHARSLTVLLPFLLLFMSKRFFPPSFS